MANKIDMRKLMTGTVKWYNVQTRFGFLLTANGDLFFHYNDGRNMRQGVDGIEWCDPPLGKRFPDPQIGDKMFFVKSVDLNHHWKASPWTTEIIFEWAKRQPKSNPPSEYRVWVQYSDSDGSNPRQPHLEWHGTDLRSSELARVWDPNPQHDSAHYVHEDFTCDKWFEKLINGQWIRLENDPRQNN